MNSIRLLLVCSVASCASRSEPSAVRAASAESTPPTASRSTFDATLEAGWIAEAKAARLASDYSTARTKAAEAVSSLLARAPVERDAAWVAVARAAGTEAWDAQDPATSNRMRSAVVSTCAATRAEDDAELQEARLELARTFRALGDVPAARELQEKVFEIRLATRPEDHPELLDVRLDLAQTMLDVGDVASARSMAEQALRICERTLSDEDPLLQKARLVVASALFVLGNNAEALELERRVLAVREQTLPPDHPDLQESRLRIASTLVMMADAKGGRELVTGVLEVGTRTLPDDHRRLQYAWSVLAFAHLRLGEFSEARALYEKVLEIRLRTLPVDHNDIRSTRSMLAHALRGLGDLEGTRVLQQEVHDELVRLVPDDHPALQSARINLASTLNALGESDAALVLREKILEVALRTYPEEHPNVQLAREGLAILRHELGYTSGVRELLERSYRLLLRAYGEGHPDVQRTRSNLALVLRSLGDIDGARLLFETELELRSRTLPESDPSLQIARLNLGAALLDTGDFIGARALFERVLEVRSRTFPDDHPELQLVRSNLAIALLHGGDAAGARVLAEKVLEVRSRTLPDEHHDVQEARANLAVMLTELGDPDAARALEEKVLEVRSRTLPDDHPDLREARMNLAVSLRSAGKLAEALELHRLVLDSVERTLPEEHPERLKAQCNIGAVLEELGDVDGALAACESALAVAARALPDSHLTTQLSRHNVAMALTMRFVRAHSSEPVDAALREEVADSKARCVELITASTRARLRAAQHTIVAGSSREVEEQSSAAPWQLDDALSLANGFGVFGPIPELETEAFVLSETLRGAAISSARLARLAVDAPQYAELRARSTDAANALATVVRRVASSAEFESARLLHETAERELVALARSLSDGASGLELAPAAIAASLDESEAIVAFRRYRLRTFVVAPAEGSQPSRVRSTTPDTLCAFVLRGGQNDAASALTLVDLGPLEPIATNVTAWRASLGLASDSRGLATSPVADTAASSEALGLALRRRILDPLLPALGNRRNLIVLPDDVLHLVPLDALPLGDDVLVGDRWRVELRSSLVDPAREGQRDGDANRLVAFGGIEYDVESHGDEEPEAVGAAEPAHVDVANVLRGTAWTRGFQPLAATADEVRGIGRHFGDRFGDDAEFELCEGAVATRARLFELAPRARWLHVATHGWFARESIESWSDAQPLDLHTGLARRSSGAEQVRGMSPMLLCGLALAGANAPDDAVGRAPGLVTAVELSTLDLTSCELVVLSACDTNVGESRAGQGVASLQKALQMAGADSVITSLWKVPDEATKELMLDFYRRLWVEDAAPGPALWAAKKRLHDARGSDGRPLYTTRDWAAWVLVGDSH